MKGLTLNVYRHADGDFTNGGVSSRHTRLTLVGVRRNGVVSELPKYAQVVEPREDAPAVVLVESALPHLEGPHIEPVDYDTSGTPPMFGGNYAASSDSRWSELGDVFGHGRISAVRVHDRIESWAQYQQLST